MCGPGSSVGIATELRAGRSGDRIPVGRDFPPVQTGPGTHLDSCTMGTGSFPGVKSGRAVLLTTHPLPVTRLWKSRAIPLPTLWATTGPVTGTLYLFFCTIDVYTPFILYLIFYSQYNLHVNMFWLPDIYIWTRILFTLLTKCISTPWGWPLEGWNMWDNNSVYRVVLTF